MHTEKNNASFCVSVSENKTPAGTCVRYQCEKCALLYYAVILHSGSYGVLHSLTHTHRPAAFSEGPRPVDFLISSILQMKQKGVEIVHLIVVSFSDSHSTLFLLCLVALVVCNPVLISVCRFCHWFYLKGSSS